MTSISDPKPAIIRTERGLAIAGTRITLYDVMDYVTAQYPPKFIAALFELTVEQINAALSYIEANRPQVEAEYQMVLKEAEELRQYWEDRNRDLFTRIAAKRPKPGTEAAWVKLQAQKGKASNPIMNFLIDHNLKGHALILMGNIASNGWLDLVPISFVTFDQIELPLILKTIEVQ